MQTSLKQSWATGLTATVLVGLGVLLLVGASLPAGQSTQERLEELAPLARALRADATDENYQRVASFFEQSQETEAGRQAAFAMGRAYFDEERWERARSWLERARKSRTLGDYAVFYLARAEAALGAHENALALLENARLRGSRLEGQAQVLRAELLVGAGKARAAADELRQQPGLWARPALMLALGEAQREAGFRVAASETLQHVYYEFPLSPEAEPASQLLGELRAELGRDYPAPGEALRRTRAEKLWAQQAYRGARSAYVDLSVRAGEPTRTEARLRAAETLYFLGGRRQACRELSRVGGIEGPLEAERLSLRAHCAALRKDDEGLEAALAALGEKFPRSSWRRRALSAAGNTAWTLGDQAGAAEFYRRLLEHFPQSADATLAHWRLAWTAFEQEREGAAALLEEHLERFPDSPFLPRALYWRAQLARRAGEERLAERVLVTLRAVAPRDYLSGRAERVLSTLRGAPAGDSEEAVPDWLAAVASHTPPPADSSLPPAVRSQLEKTEALARLGFYELAQEEIDAAARQFAHPELNRARARVAHAQGKHAQATETLRRAYPLYWRYRLDELPRAVWEMMFPRPYWEVIEREARRNRLDPYLVAGLMRQESRFEREAVSSAGALGLMQLMPRTARGLARNRRLSRERMLEPALNVRLGTRHLARLLRRFDGSLEKAVAAYNAGGSRVAEWARQFDADDPARFVESIPVTQSREFVYIVLRNYRFYQDLYAAR